jgi:hypothetical protein
MTVLLATAVAVTAVPAFSQSPHPPLQACAVKPMVAGGGNFGTLVGRVLADPVGNDLKITFDTTAAQNYDFGPYVGQFSIPGNWYITEVHAHAACLTSKTTDSFPVNKQGNPTVGKFAVSERLAPGTQSFEASFADLGSPNECPNGVVYVAAHATVRKEGTSAEYSETSWGVQFPFNALTGASQWAQFFEVELNNCDDETGVTDPPANHVPLANNDAYTFVVGSAPELLVSPTNGLLANDSDPDNPTTLKVSSVNGLAVPAFPSSLALTLPSGALTVSDNGSFAFKPKAGFTGVVTFAYTATDGFLTSAPATASITVASSTPPPPTKPVAASCYQCIGLDCLLTGKTASCPDAGAQVQDVCTTTVTDSNNVRSISRGCAVSGRDTGSTSTLPAGVGIIPGAIQDTACYNIENALLNGKTCTFVSDGRKEPGSNQPPTLLPLKEFLNKKP